MKSGIIGLSILLPIIGLSVPVTAQIRNPSQDFFEHGREQLEREIQTLQEEAPQSEQRLQKPPSEPLLQISPSPTNESTQKPHEPETPSYQKPNEVNNRKS